MKPFEYNTVAGITKQIETMEGLYAWIEERHAAGYNRQERLNQFIVLGRWVSDTCGNVARILEMDPKLNLAPVVDMEELNRNVKMRLSWGGGSGPLLPKIDSKCEVCGIGWTLDDLHEHFARRGKYDETTKRDTYTFYHTKCWRVWQLKDEHDYFAEIFRKAGYDIVVLTQTPNQYWPGAEDRNYAAPWFHVDTKIGRFLIGWRKRVIDIEWKEINRDLMCLFEDVNDTKEKHLIHAWNAEKATEYLGRIRVALDPLLSKEFEIWGATRSPYKENQPGWARLYGKSKGADFKDACVQFFKNDDTFSYYDYTNTFNGDKLFPTKQEATDSVTPKMEGAASAE